MKDKNICGFSLCEVDNEKFHYSQNAVYKYAYESSFNSFFDGTDSNDPDSNIFISADVQLTFPTKCQGQLKLSSVRLKNRNGNAADIFDKPAPSDYEYEDDDSKTQDDDQPEKSSSENILHPRSQLFSKDVEELELRFDFHDGLIHEICPSIDEPIWITNFKRGIISAFQNSMLRFDLDHKTTEDDISGKCSVAYQFKGSMNTSIEILKIKDISSCQNRNKFKSMIQTTPYAFRKSEISWWPIFNATSVCKVSVFPVFLKKQIVLLN